MSEIVSSDNTSAVLPATPITVSQKKSKPKSKQIRPNFLPTPVAPVVAPTEPAQDSESDDNIEFDDLEMSLLGEERNFKFGIVV